MKRPLAVRFWEKARTGAGCWEWTACLNANGYGQFRIGPRMVAAHRVAWELTHGQIPDGSGYHGTCVLHRCDNRRCVNPAHLFLGSHMENVRDAHAKGRAANIHGEKTHCPQGHEYTRENTGFGRMKNGHATRFCRECKRARCREQYAKNRAAHIARAIRNAARRRDRDSDAFAAANREHTRAYRARRKAKNIA